TDTLYGLAVDPRNPDAIARLYALKGRDARAALPLIAADLPQAEEAGRFDDDARRLANAWWPGPLTIVVPVGPAIHASALGGGRTVAVRVPDHAVARALARAFGFGITSTSANPSGRTPAVSPDEVAAGLPGVDLLLDAGDAPGGAPSTIVGFRDGVPECVRTGAVAWERVLESLR
ncbi:MAG TPA: L-threonylcarbamoyladenylate synthase, partial [Vicinamibacterales bacterium]|nr:L-threonylcarbamoyladenylate synthase [Vicinamibacterales bacterium]